MKSTKYQLLKSDFDFACKQLKEYREMIEKLRKEKTQAYYDGYKQGRFDEKANWFYSEGSVSENKHSFTLSSRTVKRSPD